MYADRHVVLTSILKNSSRRILLFSGICIIFFYRDFVSLHNLYLMARKNRLCRCYSGKCSEVDHDPTGLRGRTVDLRTLQKHLKADKAAWQRDRARGIHSSAELRRAIEFNTAQAQRKARAQPAHQPAQSVTQPGSGQAAVAHAEPGIYIPFSARLFYLIAFCSSSCAAGKQYAV